MTTNKVQITPAKFVEATRRLSTEEHPHLIYHSPCPRARQHPGEHYVECARAADEVFEHAFQKFKSLELAITSLAGGGGAFDNDVGAPRRDLIIAPMGQFTLTRRPTRRTLEATEEAGISVYDAVASRVIGYAGRIYFDEGLMRVTKPFVFNGMSVPRGAVIYSVIAYPWEFAPEYCGELERAFEIAESAASYARVHNLPFSPNIGMLAAALRQNTPVALRIDYSKGFTNDNVICVSGYVAILAEFFGSGRAAMEFVEAMKSLKDVVALQTKGATA